LYCGEDDTAELVLPPTCDHRPREAEIISSSVRMHVMRGREARGKSASAKLLDDGGNSTQQRHPAGNCKAKIHRQHISVCDPGRSFPLLPSQEV